MSKHRTSERRICPYYKYETGQSISCEGFQDGTTIHIGFANRNDCIKHKVDICSSSPDKCPIKKIRRQND